MKNNNDNNDNYYNKELIEIFIERSQKIIIKSFYNVLGKSIEVYYYKNDNNINKLNEYLKEFNKNIVLNLLEIDNLERKKNINEEDNEENVDGSVNIDTLFNELIEKIKELLLLPDDNILIKSIKDNVFPLYKDTYEFFIPKMPEVIKKVNIHLFKIKSNLEILVELLKKTKEEINKM